MYPSVTRSEVAVLVLGYLEREGFRNAAAAFASESREQRARVQLPPHERPMDLVRLVSEYDRLVRSTPAPPPAGSRGEVAHMYQALHGIVEDYESLRRGGGSAPRGSSGGAAAAGHSSPSRRKKREPRRRVAQPAALHDLGDAASDGAAAGIEDPLGMGSTLADELASSFGLASDVGDFDIFDILTAGNEDSFMPLAAQVAEHINRTRAADGGTMRASSAPSVRLHSPDAAATVATGEPFGAAAVAAQHIISDPALSTTFGALVRSGGAASSTSPARRHSPAETGCTMHTVLSPALTVGSRGKRARAVLAGESDAPAAKARLRRPVLGSGAAASAAGESDAPAAKARLRRPVLGSGAAASALLGANVNALLNALHPARSNRGAGAAGGAGAAPSAAIPSNTTARHTGRGGHTTTSR